MWRPECDGQCFEPNIMGWYSLRDDMVEGLPVVRDAL